MTTTDDLDEIINNTNQEDSLDNKDEKIIKEKDEKEAKSTLESNLQ
jgi:hypothetical protein